jgi:hypothetical protein
MTAALRSQAHVARRRLLDRDTYRDTICRILYMSAFNSVSGVTLRFSWSTEAVEADWAVALRVALVPALDSGITVEVPVE